MILQQLEWVRNVSFNIVIKIMIKQRLDKGLDSLANVVVTVASGTLSKL